MIFLLLFSGKKQDATPEEPTDEEPPADEVLPSYPRLDLPFVNLYYGTVGIKPPRRPPKYKLISKEDLANAKVNILSVKPRQAILDLAPRSRTVFAFPRYNLILAKPKRNVANANSRQRIITLRSLA